MLFQEAWDCCLNVQDRVYQWREWDCRLAGGGGGMRWVGGQS